MSNKDTKLNYITNYYEEQESQDYPVSFYYVDFKDMFMGTVRHHWHQKLEIDFVRNGSATFVIGDREIVVNEGDAIIINSGQIHSAYTDGKSSKNIMLSVLFSPDYLFDNNESFLTVKYRNPLISNRDFSYYHFTPDKGKEELDCIRSIITQNLNKSYGYELITKSLLCNLWIFLLSALEKDTRKASSLSLADTDRVKEAILYLHANYSKPLTLDSIAESIHLSKSECCRCFKRASHLAPFEYLMRLRIYESALLMQKGDASLKLSDLAKDTGFNNASYFNKTFKKYLGCTPSEYKERIKRSHRDALNPYGISL